MELLSERIKQARLLKNLSQKNLASKIGVSASAISQYESNADFHTEPSMKNLIAISKALGISIEWLTTGRDAKNIQNFLKNERSLPSRQSTKQKELLSLFDKLPNDFKEKQLQALKVIVKLLEK
ncbi:helix-turn-helix domain-containing protein [Candidatus Thioglobus sp.]|nr:helix-turn-helix domain-containing protein [Candidatus Thioglobus sp.]